MTHAVDSNVVATVMELLTREGFAGCPEALQILLNEAMKAERSATLGAGPHERTPERRGYANGYKDKTVATRLGPLALQVPQVRGEVAFYPSALERGVRSERALKLAVAEMYVQGVSTRRVTEVLQKLCGGMEISSGQVSRVAQMLDEELSTWRLRPLAALPYLVLDARYEKVRHGGAVVSCAVLIAVGIDLLGHRSVLGVSVSLSEAEVHWRDFLGGLQDRGLHGVQYVVSDNHAGLRAALAARLSGVKWQRCQCHLQQNAQQYVPRVTMRRAVAADLRDVFEAGDRPEAERRLKLVAQKYRQTAPKLAAWLEENVPEGLTVLELPEGHRTRLRTTNMLENLNKQVKRRTRVAGLFPNEASALRLVTAVLMETSEEWETGKVYLTMTETENA
jgi:putative transposase